MEIEDTYMLFRAKQGLRTRSIELFGGGGEFLLHFPRLPPQSC